MYRLPCLIRDRGAPDKGAMSGVPSVRHALNFFGGEIMEIYGIDVEELRKKCAIRAVPGWGHCEGGGYCYCCLHNLNLY